MSQIELVDQNNNKVGHIDASDFLPKAKFDKLLVAEVVKYQLAKKRQGTHKTKTAAEISGGGKKPFKQKGTGRARQGSSRAHHMVGGGVAHGPIPRDHSFSLSKKKRKNALKGLLFEMLTNKVALVVNEFNLDQIKTKKAKILLNNFFSQAVLVTKKENKNVILSMKNLRFYKWLPPEGLNAFDILKYKNLIITQDCLSDIKERLQ